MTQPPAPAGRRVPAGHVRRPIRAPAPAARRITATAGLELRMTLRNGEQLLLALVIPLVALIGGTLVRSSTCRNRGSTRWCPVCWCWPCCRRRSPRRRSPPGSTGGTGCSNGWPPPGSAALS